MSLPRTPAGLALALLAAACVAPAAPLGVLVASDPPGARILIDGHDSGWVTPAYLDLPDDRQRVDLNLDGYQPASLMVEPGGDPYYLIVHSEAYLGPSVWHFWLWLNYEDGLAPIKLTSGLQPARIFIPLRLATPG